MLKTGREELTRSTLVGQPLRIEVYGEMLQLIAYGKSIWAEMHLSGGCSLTLYGRGTFAMHCASWGSLGVSLEETSPSLPRIDATRQATISSLERGVASGPHSPEIFLPNLRETRQLILG